MRLPAGIAAMAAILLAMGGGLPSAPLPPETDAEREAREAAAERAREQAERARQARLQREEEQRAEATRLRAISDEEKRAANEQERQRYQAARATTAASMTPEDYQKIERARRKRDRKRGRS